MPFGYSRIRHLLPGFLLLLMALPLPAAVRVHDPELNLSFSLPDGFEPNRDLRKEKNVVQGFLLPPREGQALGVVVLVERLAGTIGRSSLGSTLKTKDNRTLQVAKEPWKSFTLDVVTVPESVNGIAAITLNVQVPLKPHAAQIKVFGELGRETELRALVRSILATSEGPTNWLTEEQRMERLGEGAGKLTGFLGIVGYGAYRLVRRFKSRSTT